jgi:hypothetical protein
MNGHGYSPLVKVVCMGCLEKWPDRSGHEKPPLVGAGVDGDEASYFTPAYLYNVGEGGISVELITLVEPHNFNYIYCLFYKIE